MSFGAIIESLSNSSSTRLGNASLSKGITSRSRKVDQEESPMAFKGLLTKEKSNLVQVEALNKKGLSENPPSSTIQISNFIFDPLSVVGKIPESNSFLQAIRKMLGKFDESNTMNSTTGVENTATPTTSSEGIDVIYAGANNANQPSQLPVSANLVGSKNASNEELMNSIEAQINYHTNSNLSSSAIEAISIESIPSADVSYNASTQQPSKETNDKNM
mgnify:CR=1 FL=1